VRRLTSLIVAATCSALVLAAAAVAAEGAHIQLTPITRSPFPERGYVVDLHAKAQVAHEQVHVSENGRPVRSFTFLPTVDASAAHFGVVLLIDASESMRGKPYEAALAAAQAFVAHAQPNEKIGVVAFNARAIVVARPTLDASAVMKAMRRPPPLAHGTHIYDAVAEALTLLRRADVLSGSIVLLSDGADTGSAALEESVAAQARHAHVRVFGVGLRSRAFDRGPLQSLAADTGATYAEASSTKALTRIYRDLGVRLASEYLLSYRSTVSPETHVDVRVTIEGVGEAATAYVAPKPAGLGPFHRSILDRFWSSPAAPFLIALLAAALLGMAPVLVLQGSRTDVLGRLSGFISIEKPEEERAQRKALTGALLAGTERSLGKTRWWTRFEEELEIAGIAIPPVQILAATVVAAFFVGFVLSLVTPIFGIFGFGVVLAVRSVISKKLNRVRDAFAEQLPDTLQVLASALRAGHSFIGALTVVVKDAPEPTRRELQRVVADDQLGVPPEESLRIVARRMASDELEQVALVAELQREAGGNMAEVLDTVVETIRERFDLRRLIQTLTAQGRLARWVVSLLPVAVALAVTLINPAYMRPLFTSSGGQILIAICAVMIICGSLVIKKIINIKV
jgi:tight adherence protein B